MKFEYDPNKSASNKKKHGIDFEEAKKLWTDPVRIVIQAKTVEGEDRWMLYAKYTGHVYAAVFTPRKEIIRIISARRASHREAAYYEDKNK